jgi:NAD(P)H dehydrogenase (quinone)
MEAPMKTILYSKTGNTLSVGKALSEKTGAHLDCVLAESDDPKIQDPVLTEVPDPDDDHLVFGSPVHGFQLSQIMKSYLEGLDDLSGKTVDLFVTHFFPFAWMGGKVALRQMKKIVVSKGGAIGRLTCVNWSRKRDKTIQVMLEAHKA